jgi:hypothetical protein
VDETFPLADLPAEQHGRKGIAYDWQSLYVAAQLAGLDTEIRDLLSSGR